MFFIQGTSILSVPFLHYALLGTNIVFPSRVMLDTPFYHLVLPTLASVYTSEVLSGSGRPRRRRKAASKYIVDREQSRPSSLSTSPGKLVNRFNNSTQCHRDDASRSKPVVEKIEDSPTPAPNPPGPLYSHQCSPRHCSVMASMGVQPSCCGVYGDSLEELPRIGDPVPKEWVHSRILTEKEQLFAKVTLPLRSFARLGSSSSDPAPLAVYEGPETGFVLVSEPDLVEQWSNLSLGSFIPDNQPTRIDGRLSAIRPDTCDHFCPMANCGALIVLILALVADIRLVVFPARCLLKFVKIASRCVVKTFRWAAGYTQFVTRQYKEELSPVPLPPSVYVAGNLTAEARSHDTPLLPLVLAQAQGISGITLPFKYIGKRVKPAKKFKWVLFKNERSSASYSPPKAPRGPAHEVSGHLHFVPPNKHVYSPPYRYLQDGEHRGWTMVCHKKRTKEQVKKGANARTSSLEPVLSVTKEGCASFMPIHPSRYMGLKVYEAVDSFVDPALGSSSPPGPSDTRPAIKDEDLTPVVARTSVPSSYAGAVDKDAGCAAPALEGTVNQERGEGVWPPPEKVHVKLPVSRPSALPRSQGPTRPTFRQSKPYRIVAGSGVMRPIKNQPEQLEDRVEVDWQLTATPPTSQRPAQKAPRHRNQVLDTSFAPTFEVISTTRFAQPHVRLPISLNLPTNPTSSLASRIENARAQEHRDRMRDSGKGKETKRSPLADEETTTRAVEEDLYLDGPTTVAISLPPRNLYAHIPTRSVVREHKKREGESAQLSSLDLTMARFREAMKGS